MKTIYPVSDRKTGASRDGIRIRSTQIQVLSGEVIGVWTIVSEAPIRVNGKLMWSCRCTAAHHEKFISTSELAYGVQPTKCSQCLDEEQKSAAAKSVNARKVLADCLSDARANRIVTAENQKAVQEPQDERPKEQLHV